MADHSDGFLEMNKLNHISVFKNVKRVLGLIISVAILLAGFDAHAYLGAGNRSGPAEAGKDYPARLIVKFKKPVTAAKGTVNIQTLENLESISELNKEFKIHSVVPFRGRRGLPGSYHFKDIYILRAEAGADLEEIAAEYARLPNVEYAEPDYLMELHTIPSDVLYPQQWGLNNFGQWHYYVQRRPGDGNDKLKIRYGLPDADIDADEVYQNPPDKTVTSVVAVIDTGVDLDHPDLETSIWRNVKENPNNGIDDDHNGYIDDVLGWDFSAVDDIIEGEIHDNDPTDEFGHGTHCAGIIAGIANNGMGIAGVSTTCKIMPIKIFPWPLISTIAEAVIYVADNGGDVISMSFGYPYRSYLLEEALNYAKAKGVVLCASTGNSGINEANFPAAFDATIAVGSTNDSDHVSVYSTYGEHLSVCAPGQDILSLRADSTDMYDDHEPNVHIFGENYYLASGTSMSCPHVAGIAGYIRSIAPGLLPDRVQEIIEQTADDLLDPYNHGDNYPGRDVYSGYGRASLKKALDATPHVHARLETPYPNEIVSGQVDIWGRAYERESILTDYIIELGKGKLPEQWNPVFGGSTWLEYDRLGSWNTEGLAGYYTLRLKVGTENIHQRTVFVANENLARVDYPSAGDTIFNFIDIYATAYGPDYRYLILEYGAGENPTQFETLASSSRPADNELITDWIVEILPEGIYTLRLSVYSAYGLETQTETKVFVRSIFSSDNAWKTTLNSPVTITANYGDLNNDGQTEIYVGTEDGLKVLKLGGGEDTVNTVFPENNFLIPPAIGDLDGDGIDDLVAMGHNPSKVYGFPSSGEPFETPVSFTVDVGQYTDTEHDFPILFLKDVDNDSRDEIHLMLKSDYNAKAAMLSSGGSYRLSLDSVSEYLPADLNGDGYDEIYVYNYLDQHLKQLNLNGQVVDSLYLEYENELFICNGLAAYDIDRDSIPELAVFGQFYRHGYWLYFMDDGLNIKSGWPIELNIPTYLTPTMPVFVDLDEDDQPEFISTTFGISYSYIHIWNVDGTSFLPGNPDGLFATIPRPGVLNMPTVADINGDGRRDIICCANDDIFFTYRAQRIYAWDYSGQLLDDYPIIVTPRSPLIYFGNFRFTPFLGDLNNSGTIDLIMPTSDSSTVFLDFAGSSYNACNVPLPMWRYNRRLNNTGWPVSCSPTGVDDEPASTLPTDFALRQNFPNPFNPSTVLEYSLPSRSEVELAVYNLLGRKVRTLVSGTQSAGVHRVTWDGRDNGGNDVATGVYLYRISCEDFEDARKMVLIR